MSGGKGHLQDGNIGSFAVDYNNRTTESNFCSKCNAWKGELGLEPTFDLYIKHLCDIFDEVKRVLKDTGTIFVNLGDTFASGTRDKGTVDLSRLDSKEAKATRGWHIQPNRQLENYPAKSLCCIPERFMIEMINRGWILRNKIVWYKKNCMPSSAKDRFTVDWDHLLFFSKSNKTQYWTNSKTKKLVSNQPLGTKGMEGIDWEWKEINNSWERPSRDEIFKTPSRKKSTYAKAKRKKVSLWTGHDYYFEQQFDKYSDTYLKDSRHITGTPEHHPVKDHEKAGVQKPTQIHDNSYGKLGEGRNKRCVWAINPKPFSEAHFAVFPEELCWTPIKAGVPEFICKKCGKAREKIFEEINSKDKPILNKGEYANDTDWNTNPKGHLGTPVLKEIGYTNCNCSAGFEPGVVMDIFMGAGTVGLVAEKLQRRWIGIDLNKKYCKMAKERIEIEADQIKLEF